MRSYPSSKAELARKLRVGSLTFAEIGKKIHVSERAVSRWCHGINCNSRQYISAIEKKNRIIEDSRTELSKFALDKLNSKVIAAILYWAEGGKYPQTTSVSFCNSDPKMIKFFIGLLRSGFDLDETKFRVHLQLHDTHDKENLFKFWSNLLGVPVSKFWKPTVTSPKNKMKRDNYVGTCTIRYHDVNILFKLMGIYENIANGKVAEWPKAAHC